MSGGVPIDELDDDTVGRGPGTPQGVAMLVPSVSNATTYSPVTIYTTVWCGHCRRLKAALDRVGIEFREVDIEHDAAAAAFVAGVNGGNHTVPTVLLVDGSVLTNPTIDEVTAVTSALEGLSATGH